jgi:hypothetical protein
MTWTHNAGGIGCKALAIAAIALLCLPTAWARGQRYGASAPAYASAPRVQSGRLRNQPRNQMRNQGRVIPRSQMRVTPQIQSRQQESMAQRPAAGNLIVAPRSNYPASSYSGQSYSRPYAPAYSLPGSAPPGHLGAWLNEHRMQPLQEQERILRSDPSFQRLNPAVQQRLVDQLHEVNQLPEGQRERRLARAEALEHLSAQDRMSVNLSARRLAAMPQDRQAMVRRAFRDLRSVPLDQRQTVLNSARYQGAFSPDERGILSDLLRVEPYQPAR